MVRLKVDAHRQPGTALEVNETRLEVNKVTPFLETIKCVYQINHKKELKIA